MDKLKFRKRNYALFAVLHALVILWDLFYIGYILIPYPSPLSVILFLFFAFLTYSILPFGLLGKKEVKGEDIQSDKLKEIIDSILSEVGLDLKYVFIPVNSFDIHVKANGKDRIVIKVGAPLLLVLNDDEFEALLLKELEPFISGKVQKDSYLTESLSAMIDFVDSIAWKDSAVKSGGSAISGVASGDQQVGFLASMSANAEVGRQNKMTIFNFLLFPVYIISKLILKGLIYNHQMFTSGYEADKDDFSINRVGGLPYNSAQKKVEKYTILHSALKSRRYSMDTIIPELMDEYNNLYSNYVDGSRAEFYKKNIFREISMEMERTILNNFIFKLNLSLLNFVT